MQGTTVTQTLVDRVRCNNSSLAQHGDLTVMGEVDSEEVKCCGHWSFTGGAPPLRHRLFLFGRVSRQSDMTAWISQHKNIASGGGNSCCLQEVDFHVIQAPGVGAMKYSHTLVPTEAGFTPSPGAEHSNIWNWGMVCIYGSFDPQDMVQKKGHQWGMVEQYPRYRSMKQLLHPWKQRTLQLWHQFQDGAEQEQLSLCSQGKRSALLGVVHSYMCFRQ